MANETRVLYCPRYNWVSSCWTDLEKEALPEVRLVPRFGGPEEHAYKIAVLLARELCDVVVAPQQKTNEAWVRKLRALKRRASSENAFNRAVRAQMHAPQFNTSRYDAFVDKLRFKAYAASRGVRTFRTLRVFDAPSDADLRGLPPRFVVKSTKGSGRNLLVRDGVEALNGEKVSAAWLREVVWPRWTEPYSPRSEPWYEFTRPRIFVEEMVEPWPDDLKVVVRRGRAAAVWVDSQRFARHRRNVYRSTPELAPIPCFWGAPMHRGEDAVITQIRSRGAGGALLAMAESLAAGVDAELVRIDLYWRDGALYGGEVTLAPAGGTEAITRECHDLFFTQP